MIGAVTYELKVEQSARMEGFAGRLLHAVFFQLLSDFNAELATRVHAESSFKPFTVSPLIRTHREPEEDLMIFNKEPFMVKAGRRFFWRITTWSEEILAMAVTVPIGTKLQIGHVPCTVQQVYSDGRHESGVITPKQIIQEAVDANNVQAVTLEFLSPVAFRRGAQDYPLPDPQLVFTSLAKKWEAAQMPARIDAELITTMEERLVPCQWSGRTEQVYFGRHHGATGFLGSFSYSLKALSEEEAQIIKILAQLAVFTGVGRLTAQGFGQTRLHWQQQRSSKRH